MVCQFISFNIIILGGSRLGVPVWPSTRRKMYTPYRTNTASPKFVTSSKPEIYGLVYRSLMPSISSVAGEAFTVPSVFWLHL